MTEDCHVGLVLQDLRISHAGAVLVDLCVRIAPGAVLTVMGASGSGKSTLLAALTGTLPRGFQASGKIVLNGRDVTALPTRARRMGILFQDDVLFPHLSVAGNLGFGLPARLADHSTDRGTDHSTDRGARIAAALGSVGLAGYGARDPATLSGGERSRVALLRTLLADPQALLLDEPFSRLDAGLRVQIRGLVLDRARALRLPVILVTHDPEDARAAAGPVLTPLGVPVGV